MKVLFLPQTTPDGLGDVVYSGLKRSANVSVHEFPFKAYFHAVSLPHIVKSKVVDSILLPKPKWLKQNHPIEQVYDSLDEIDFGDFDYIISYSLSREIGGIVPELISRAKNRLKFLEGDDSPFYQLMIRQTKFYFKREKCASPVKSSMTMCKYQYLMGFYRARNSIRDSFRYSFPIPQIPPFFKNVFSLNFSVLDHDYLKETDKDIDVSLVGRLTNWS